MRAGCPVRMGTRDSPVGRIAKPLVLTGIVRLRTVGDCNNHDPPEEPMDSTARHERAEQVVTELRAWADTRPDVLALALVGSYAHPSGAETAESDVDIIVVTSDPDRYTGGTEHLPPALELPLLRAKQWGMVAERRSRHAATGLVVELNITTPLWAATEPEVDGGTRRVVRDGIRVLHDRDGLLAKLIDACGAGGTSRGHAG